MVSGDGEFEREAGDALSKAGRGQTAEDEACSESQKRVDQHEANRATPTAGETPREGGGRSHSKLCRALQMDARVSAV